MSTKSRVKALEAKNPALANGNIMALPDRQLARAVGSTWLLACTDSELEEVASGVEDSNPARYREIVESARNRGG